MGFELILLNYYNEKDRVLTIYCILCLEIAKRTKTIDEALEKKKKNKKTTHTFGLKNAKTSAEIAETLKYPNEEVKPDEKSEVTRDC